MKTLKGITNNIEEELLGRITYKKNISLFKSKDIFVSINQTSIPSRYLAVITNNNSKAISNSRVVNNVVNASELNTGDIVSINKDGEIRVQFEKESRHNAIMVTERCNHRCIMCPQPPVNEEIDKTDYNLELISLLDKKTEEIGLTGGEPTLIGDKLFTLIKHIQKKLPNTRISILSNGVKFADYEYTRKLALCNHFDLQIDIPIFSDIDTEHNRIVGAKTFYKTIEGLYNLALLKQKIGLRFVIHKQTYKRLPQLSEFIYRNFPFVCNVAFMQMETTGLAAKNLQELWIDPYEYNKELQEAVLSLSKRGMNVSIYNAQLCVLPENLRPFAKQSISDWKDIFLEECDNCKLKNCCAGFFESTKDHHSTHINAI
nr:His-Xaa-Ser system radical SAM maturase HxsC [uncultured Bacteroides sp.]